MIPAEPSPEQIAAGHAFYTPRTLAIYDLAILGFFSRVAWRCPADRILAHYNEHVSGNHLDIGVGTGFFLDRCEYPVQAPRIGLLDVSRACLDVASRRIDRYHPEIHSASVLAPLELAVAPFDSLALNYVLHCLPGNLQSKQIVFEHIRSVAAPQATVFGATLLSGGVPRNWFARQVTARNNRVGIFSNRFDDLDGLQSILGHHLEDATVEVVGCVAVFAGRLRRTDA